MCSKTLRNRQLATRLATRKILEPNLALKRSGRRDSKPSLRAANSGKFGEIEDPGAETPVHSSRGFLHDGSFGPAGSQRDPEDIAFEMALAEHAERALVAAVLATPILSATTNVTAGSGPDLGNFGRPSDSEGAR